MALDGKMLARAKSKLEEKRRQKEERLGQRQQEVYLKAPCVRELDSKLRATMAELVGAALGVDAASRVDDIRARNLKLQEQRYSEIKQAGFPENYLDDDYMCPKCRDTGYIDTRMCRCLEKIYKEEQRKSLSSLLKLGNETFDNFDLSFYDDTSSADKSISPRSSMEVVYNTCVEYARKFGSKSRNLLLIGSPGLGKTFLSACIARVVAENGFSVVYDMAASIFSKFEDAKFQRTEDFEGLRNEINRYLTCDLLIIDDLGTEMTTAFTISALYEIINSRLITGKKTLVNTNLTMEELDRRYSEQIMSRLDGEYHKLKFHGNDI